MKWSGDGSTSDGVEERGFELACKGRTVPGVLWTPANASGARPLVLLGHGGSAHKRVSYILSLGRRLVRHLGFAAAAIDGPVHGDRRPLAAEGAEVRSEFRRAWRRPETTDEMVADWKATLDALQKLPEIGQAALGYWGLSMGTILGLPFVAAEPRMGAAVLGLCGTVGPTEGRLRRDAAQITCPVLFVQQWHDELFPRERVHDLFDRLGARDKSLHANPGAHAAVPPHEFDASEAFLAKHLSGQ